MSLSDIETALAAGLDTWRPHGHLGTRRQVGAYHLWLESRRVPRGYAYRVQLTDGEQLRTINVEADAHAVYWAVYTTLRQVQELSR